MMTAISSANSCFYDPNAQLSTEGGCDSSNASCGPPPESPLEVTIPPVAISGDAGGKQLLKQLDDARGAPDCSLEAKNAALSCPKAALTAVGGVVASASVAGAVLGAVATLVESVTCGKDLRAYYDCEQP
jgi:hypothetical protein